MFPNIFGKIWKIGWAAFADVSEVARLAGLLDWLDWLALLGPFLLLPGWAGLGWLGPLVVVVVFLCFLFVFVDYALRVPGGNQVDGLPPARHFHGF